MFISLSFDLWNFSFFKEYNCGNIITWITLYKKSGNGLKQGFHSNSATNIITIVRERRRIFRGEKQTG